MDRDAGYRPPGRTERDTVAEGVGLLLDGDRPAAEKRLSSVDFAVRTVTDRASGRRYAEVADAAEGGESRRGWGRVYLELGQRARWSVQVPHPSSDLHTDVLGSAVLRGSRNGVLVLAGAHRRAGSGDAADGAHRGDTVFAAVCAELLARKLPALQLHGFADDSVPGYEAVVATGSTSLGRGTARELARGLERGDLAVCRAWAHHCKLEGRDNEQTREAARERVPFLHVELSRRVRKSERQRAVAARELAAAGQELAGRGAAAP
ncbi:hypothetical protein ACFQLX_11005 [Streptomyces polyrhachis]|uniref:Uncharacterized protein n=1 Tax=Streptomyces polyrhachis TaxID=1282885 RepID=A0ABW2GDK6_9ACTN